MPTGLVTVVNDLKRRWAEVAKGAAWVGVVVLAVLQSPPILRPEGDRAAQMAQLTVAVTFGLLLVAVMRWKAKRHALIWAGVAVLFLLAGVWGYFAYDGAVQRTTAAWHDHRYVIGELRLDPETVQVRQKCLDVTIPGVAMSREANILDCVHGDVLQQWTHETVIPNQRLCLGLYLLTAVLFEISVVAMLQAVKCATARQTAERRKPAPKQRRASAQ
jgi:4-amino-4-deoxy-L-arabinose transferase-like glycosyltransferase